MSLHCGDQFRALIGYIPGYIIPSLSSLVPLKSIRALD